MAINITELDEAIKQSERICSGEHVFPKESFASDCLGLAIILDKRYKFGVARNLLDYVQVKLSVDPEIPSNPKLRKKIAQKLALYTYKDPGSKLAEALDKAFACLDEYVTEGDWEQETDPEHLGLAGAICKRRWEAFGDITQLLKAVAYYQQGFDHGLKEDDGYTGINAAYLYDEVADQLTRIDDSLKDKKKVAEFRDKAKKIRSEIIRHLETKYDIDTQNGLFNGEHPWWVYATLGECYLGLGHTDLATAAFDEGKRLSGWDNDPDAMFRDWQFQSTARQARSLTELLVAADPTKQKELDQFINNFLNGNTAAIESTRRGKLGLALSGGGFRASFYEIGVLCRLAESNILKGVEVLSCVSGGSIFGAHYFLELKNQYRSTKKSYLDQDDYLEIMSRIVEAFTAGVQRNLRMRIARNPLKTLWMMLSPTYSRSIRLARLYENELYSRVQDGNEGNPRYISRLTIEPPNTTDFSPLKDNWARPDKIPILVLNATTLNTGHNWQFSSTWMGEPPYEIDPEVDKNDRLRRVYYNKVTYMNTSLEVK